MDNYWYYGPPGTGKSWRVRELCEPHELYLKNSNKWWDGYSGQPYVLIDDLGKDTNCLATYLKIWADIYAFRPEIKQACLAPIRPKRIFITSNYHPRDIFENEVDIQAIERRFKIV